jgi:hypothetical protein
MYAVCTRTANENRAAVVIATRADRHIASVDSAVTPRQHHGDSSRPRGGEIESLVVIAEERGSPHHPVRTVRAR